MPRAAVLGSPIAHSLSPVMHRAAYAALGLDEWSYDAIECGAADLEAMVAQMRDTPDWVGLSLTMPLKLDILPMLDELDPLSESLGAVNTVVRPDGRLLGRNTDVAGAVAALRSLSGAIPTQAVVIGGGGSARAVLPALRECGVSHARVVVRDPSRAAALKPIGERRGLKVSLHPWSALPEEIASAALVVSTVPAGAQIDAGTWPARAALFDLTYAPWPTALMTAARSAGADAIGGLVMLAHQAAGQVELMTGQAVDAQILLDAALAHLD